MNNSISYKTEAQIRNDVIADVAVKLCPPFSVEYLAKEIFGLKSKQSLFGIIKSRYPNFSAKGSK